MINVMRFALSFNNPHRNCGVGQMALIKMKDCFLSDNIQNLLHDSPLVKLYVYLSVVPLATSITAAFALNAFNL